MPRKRRASKIDRFAHLLGLEPDRVVAELAGVGKEAVRLYRRRRGLPGWSEDPDVVAVAEVQPKVSRIAPFADQLGLVPDSAIAKLAGVRTDTVTDYRRARGIAGYRRPAAPVVARRTYEVTVREGGVDRAYVVVATDLADAAARAVAAAVGGEVIRVDAHLPLLVPMGAADDLLASPVPPGDWEATR